MESANAKSLRGRRKMIDLLFDFIYTLFVINVTLLFTLIYIKFVGISGGKE